MKLVIVLLCKIMMDIHVLLKNKNKYKKEYR